MFTSASAIDISATRPLNEEFAFLQQAFDQLTIRRMAGKGFDARQVSSQPTQASRQFVA
jgi:hypothetical protein